MHPAPSNAKKTRKGPAFMRVAIVTSGRFYVLDLARELAALGHEVHFYSYVPRARAQLFGLPPRCHRALLPLVFPLVGLERYAPANLRALAARTLIRGVDRAAAALLEPCDVFVGMSGLCVESAKRARARYGAKIVIDRGSRHILSQKEILESIPGARRPAISQFDVDRELWGYDFADLITVPSRHVERSFLEQGVPAQKLFRNPFGVDLAMFPPTDAPKLDKPTVLFTGSWCLRKGCDVLWDACRAAGSWHLLHVGSVGDFPLPDSPLFAHRDPVSQQHLVDVYRQANVFVQPSREEGLSLIQAQALACGLPLVCTDRTGGEDLREQLGDPGWVTVVPHGDPGALGEGIAKALEMAARQRGTRDILGGAREQLSWSAYGRRYAAKLRELL
jgi:glycosyltransferase involved in cell wall biosynthesis